MIEMLKNRKEALQERGVKGFTLMEMLIVIAIIAVLVAIAIPVLGAQLDRSKDATDEANARSVYGLVQADAMSPAPGKSATDITVTPELSGNNKDAKVTVKLSDGTEQVFDFSARTQDFKVTINANGQVTAHLKYANGTQTVDFGTTSTSASASASSGD